MESERGVGSAFSVFFPKLGNAIVARRLNARAGQSELSVPGDAGLNGRARVVIVEDNQVNAKMLATFLQSEGHQTIVAEDGPAALAELGLQGADVVLMDIQLPGMSGLEVIGRIRDMDGLAGLPIVATTAMATEDDERRCLEAGADAFLSKPLNLTALLQLIEGLRAR